MICQRLSSRCFYLRPKRGPQKNFQLYVAKTPICKDQLQNCIRKIVQSVQLASKVTNFVWGRRKPSEGKNWISGKPSSELSFPDLDVHFYNHDTHHCDVFTAHTSPWPHCDIMSPQHTSLWHHCDTISPYTTHITVTSLWHHLTVHYTYHCDITVSSLWHHCYINHFTAHNTRHCDIISPQHTSLSHNYDIILPYTTHITVTSLWHHLTVHSTHRCDITVTSSHHNTHHCDIISPYTTHVTVTSSHYSHFRLVRTRLTRNFGLQARKPLVQNQIAFTHILNGFG